MKQLCGLICLFLSLAVAGQSMVETHLDVVVDRQSFRHALSELVFENPAHQPLRFDSSFSSLAVGCEGKRSDNQYLMQTGTGEQFAEFETSSYVRLGDRSCAWGEARYRNGLQLDVKWNENADYERIFPYVTADTLGGNLNYESYYFKGGYGIQLNRFSVGAQMAYSSALHYRQTDPRPKNNSVFINATVGGSYRITARYSLGVHIFAERYTQNQSIAFLDPLGSVPVYHMTGLGMHYVRFAGTRTESIYKGRSYRGGITLKRLGDTGLDVGLQVENYKLQKQLPSLSNAPINDVDQMKYEVAAAWKLRRVQLELNGSYANRSGSERIYDDGTTNWHEITSTKPYKYTEKKMMATVLFQPFAGYGWTLELMPSVGYQQEEECYYPLRSQEFDRIGLRLAAGLRYRMERHLFSFSAQGGWLHCLSSSWKVENPDYFPYSDEMLRRNYANLSADLNTVQLQFQHNTLLKRMPASVYWRVGYSLMSTFRGFTGHGVNLSVGFTI